MEPDDSIPPMHRPSHARDFTKQNVADYVLAVPWRRAALEAVANLNLSDCWIGAGFVRGPIWDLLHGYQIPTPLPDIDVIYFDTTDVRAERDRTYSRTLTERGPQLPWSETCWSVKNQARMHLKTGAPSYGSTEDALRHWLETPTAVALRLEENGRIETLAPFGVDDLTNLVLRPTPYACTKARDAYRKRIEEKGWLKRWPKIRVLMP